MILHADARFLPLRQQVVDCCVTSPPYFGLRDYGHPKQIGLEPTPEAYIATLVKVFQGVWRVLKDDGTLWLNLADSFAGSGQGGGGSYGPERRAWRAGDEANSRNGSEANRNGLMGVKGAKAKDLLGMPWRVAFALQADGWYLRSDIIWAKPNPMPESVTDRPTKSHEYLFLLAKQERYYYDADAIKEPARWTRENNPDWQIQRAATNARKGAGNRNAADGGFTGWSPDDGRNKRSVWTINTEPFDGAHFACMPEALVEPCILAGCPLGGLVLDPFIGSGTVGAVAERLGRRWVGCDLAYHDLAKERTAQRGLAWT
jgi:DNA modification methylase